MLEITVILTAAAIAFGITRATRIPAIPLLLAAGIAMSAAGAMPDQSFVLDILQVGLAFLVFAAGMDMSPARVGKQRKLAYQVGITQFVVLGAIAGLMTLGGGYSLEAALYVALAISASSTLVVVRLLKVRREIFESFGRMIIGVLLLQDLLVIAGLVILTAIGAEAVPLVVFVGEWAVLGEGFQAAFEGRDHLIVVMTALGLVAASIGMGRRVLPAVVKHFHQKEETTLLIVLATLFAFSGFAYLGGVPVVVGAFCAGLSLSSFPTRSLVAGLITSLSDFFLVVFFLSLGALVSLPSLRALIEGLILVALILIATPLIVAVVAERAGMTSRGALEAGLLIAQTSEFSLVVAVYGWQSGQIDGDLFSVLVFVTVITMTVTPMLSSKRLGQWLMHFHPKPGPKTTAPDREDHVVIIGGGTAGTLLVQHFAEVKFPVVVVDHDPIIVTQFRDERCDSVWGDAESLETLREAGVECARAVIVTTGNLHHLRQVQRLAPNDASIWLHAFGAETATAARQMGAKTVVYADASAENFMRWFKVRWPSTES